MARMNYTKSGFTIVELLIVIVVIAILAAISVGAYSGIQQRARDTQRKSDVATIQKVLEYYYSINGEYPPSHGSGSTAINSSWVTTADGTWQQLADRLAPTYVSSLPVDPTGSTSPAISGGGSYDYVRINNSTYCGSSQGQGYLLAYRLEGSSQLNTYSGSCTGTQLGPYGNASNHRVIK